MWCRGNQMFRIVLRCNLTSLQFWSLNLEQSCTDRLYIAFNKPIHLASDMCFLHHQNCNEGTSSYKHIHTIFESFLKKMGPLRPQRKLSLPSNLYCALSSRQTRKYSFCFYFYDLSFSKLALLHLLLLAHFKDLHIWFCQSFKDKHFASIECYVQPWKIWKHARPLIQWIYNI